MFEKIKDYFGRPTLRALNDTRLLGLLAFGVIALLVTWSGIKSIQTNYELQKQISELSQQNGVDKLENTNLKLRNEYLKTDQYLELAARQKFGKAAPGETVYIVPKSVALANSVAVKKPVDVKKQKEAAKPAYQRNLQAWFDFFFSAKN
jgi:cell division protein FtsB